MEEVKMATGGLKKAWDLHVDLMRALRDSNAFNSQNSMSYMYDILIGIGQFTAEVLTTLNRAIKLEEGEEFDVYDLYMKILSDLKENI